MIIVDQGCFVPNMFNLECLEPLLLLLKHLDILISVIIVQDKIKSTSHLL